MKIYVDDSAAALGQRAADETARRICETVEKRGECRLLLSTGASQFPFFDALTVKKYVPWDRVVMFHLDEFVGMADSHPASFRRYLRERFVDKVQPKAYYFVNGEGDVQANIASLTARLREAPIDIALIGIGENGHIAFNDPPADFDSREAYRVVTLEERCRRQQLGEGWFASLEEVPDQAVSMTVHQIMQSRAILSVVPDARKAEAIGKTLRAPTVTNLIPATILREHPDWTLYLDRDSASMVDESRLH